MDKILNILKNRNTLLILSLVAGLSYTGLAPYIKPFTIYILAVVMIFSVTGISFKILKDYKSVMRVSLHAILLNFIILGVAFLLPAYFLFNDKEIFLGFVVIVATPPGIAILPFTYNFKGDLDYSFKGVLGSYLVAIVLTPLIIGLFAQEANISPIVVIVVILKVIFIPLILSRFLRNKKILPTVEKVRGKIIDYGFAIIIYTAIALNRDAIFSNIDILLKSVLIIVFAMFVIGYFYNLIMKKRINRQLLISHNLMISVKSSGFAVATSLAVFGDKAAIPSSILAVFVLLYLVWKGFFYK